MRTSWLIGEDSFACYPCGDIARCNPVLSKGHPVTRHIDLDQAPFHATLSALQMMKDG